MKYERADQKFDFLSRCSPAARFKFSDEHISTMHAVPVCPQPEKLKELRPIFSVLIVA